MIAFIVPALEQSHPALVVITNEQIIFSVPFYPRSAQYARRAKPDSHQ
jgi:hypothetical protein